MLFFPSSSGDRHLQFIPGCVVLAQSLANLTAESGLLFLKVGPGLLQHDLFLAEALANLLKVVLLLEDSMLRAFKVSTALAEIEASYGVSDHFGALRLRILYLHGLLVSLPDRERRGSLWHGHPCGRIRIRPTGRPQRRVRKEGTMYQWWLRMWLSG